MERRWTQSRLTIHRDLFNEQRRHVNQLVSSDKYSCSTANITGAAYDIKQMFIVVNTELIKPEPSLPDGG